jgi:SAM-dependent methyltransferase
MLGQKEKFCFLRNQAYNLLIRTATNHCYKNCLEYLPDNSSILDVGIGNGTMLKNYHSLIKGKGLKITGIDINKIYLAHCSSLIRGYQLENHVEIVHMPVESYHPPREQYFDFILFSMSFMLFVDQHLVLDRIRDWLKPGGKIIFFQAMFDKRYWFIDFIKLRLKYVTTVDFGRAIYEEEFFALLNEKNLSVSEYRLVKKEWYKGTYCMIVASIGNGRGKRCNGT